MKAYLQKLQMVDHEKGTASAADQWQPFSCAPPETPTETMEFLARSWSLSAMELSKALAVSQPAASFSAESVKQEHQQLQKTGVVISPPDSPRDSEEMKLYKGILRGRTMGRWLKDQKERKKQEIRTHNAQLHAAVSVAGVASAVAALLSASATASSSVTSRRLPHAFPAAAALVASHCIEIAEDMGAEHEHILAAVKSAVNARSSGDIMTLTAAAATALRGAATLRARLLPIVNLSVGEEKMNERRDVSRETALKFVRRGGELLKRTRKGALHWKQVSVHMNSNWQVVVRMKSMYMGGTFIKKNKFVVNGVCCDIPTWPGREYCDQERAYFGIVTLERVIEFECKGEGEKQMWSDGIQQMLNCQKSMPML